MNRPEDDVQLKVWKELAISKQMLMRTATDALGLDPECTQEELKTALEKALKKIAEADSEVVNAKAAAAVSITALEKKLAAMEKDLAAAQQAANEAKAAHEGVVQQLANQRSTAAAELQKAKNALAEREKALKAINVALADTPANVLQKMNTLKKQKQEEADARRALDTALNTMRAEKRQQDQRLAELQKHGTTLVTRHRELHELASKLREQAVAAAEDKTSVPGIPELDTKLLETIEQPAEKNAKNPAQLRAVNS